MRPTPSCGALSMHQQLCGQEAACVRLGQSKLLEAVLASGQSLTCQAFASFALERSLLFVDKSCQRTTVDDLVGTMDKKRSLRLDRLFL